PGGATRISLAGKTVIPTLINAHGHPGFQRGLTYSAENFTRENIMDDLNRALYFGVAVVQSQGIEKGDVTYEIRADQEAGKLGGARLRIAGRGEEGEPDQDLGRRSKRTGAEPPSRHLPRDYRRRPPARVAGERPRVLPH